MDERLTDLEIKVAFQEHTTLALDDVLRALVDRVDRLERELTALREEHRAAMTPVESERPPHY